MTTDRPTQAEVEALIAELQIGDDPRHPRAIALLRRLAATVPRAGAVPMEPTEQMILAAGNIQYLGGRDRAAIIWRAMYDAAPHAVLDHQCGPFSNASALNLNSPERAPSGDGPKYNVCPKCHNQFVQPFCCITCGAEQLYDYTLKSTQDALAEARAEIARLKPNAERYQFLRKPPIDGRHRDWLYMPHSEALDASIDAVLHEET